MTLISGVGEVIGPIVVVFLAAALLTYALTPQVRRIALRYRIVDRPNSRRVNRRPIPRSGGLAVAATFLGVAGVFLLLNDATHLVAVPFAMRPLDVAALFIGGAAAAVLGALDDLFDLRARWQFLGQIGLAVGAVVLGIGIDFINNPFEPGRVRFPPPVAIGFTVFWIVGMNVALNFIDGLDGLAGLISATIFAAFGVVALAQGQFYLSRFCFTIVGALFGFLWFNVHPAELFMGDTGSLALGATLAVVALMTGQWPLLLVIAVIPLSEALSVVIQVTYFKLTKGKRFFKMAPLHLHFELLGWSETQVVQRFWLIGLLAAMVGMGLAVV